MKAISLLLPDGYIEALDGLVRRKFLHAEDMWEVNIDDGGTKGN